MTNNNNRPADDVIVCGGKQLNKYRNSWGKLERARKPINLSALAKELMKGSFDDWTREKAINDFLSKIREAMK